MIGVEGQMRPRWWQFVLLGTLAGILLLFFLGLGRDVKFIPSPLIDRQAPEFTLARLDGKGVVDLSSYRGRAVVLNFWASWCVSCRQEHDELVKLGRRFGDGNKLALLGIDYKDTPTGAKNFLSERGAFPYPSGVDRSGKTGLEYGVYGLPETFFINEKGMIVAKHIGPLTENIITEKLTILGIKR